MKLFYVIILLLSTASALPFRFSRVRRSVDSAAQNSKLRTGHRFKLFDRTSASNEVIYSLPGETAVRPKSDLKRFPENEKAADKKPFLNHKMIVLIPVNYDEKSSSEELSESVGIGPIPIFDDDKEKNVSNRPLIINLDDNSELTKKLGNKVTGQFQPWSGASPNDSAKKSKQSSIGKGARPIFYDVNKKQFVDIFGSPEEIPKSHSCESENDDDEAIGTGAKPIFIIPTQTIPAGKQKPINVTPSPTSIGNGVNPIFVNPSQGGSVGLTNKPIKNFPTSSIDDNTPIGAGAQPQIIFPSNILQRPLPDVVFDAPHTINAPTLPRTTTKTPTTTTRATTTTTKATTTTTKDDSSSGLVSDESNEDDDEFENYSVPASIEHVVQLTPKEHINILPNGVAIIKSSDDEFYPGEYNLIVD